jgi:hypothetical protein
MRVILTVALLGLIATLMVVISNTTNECLRAAEASCRGSKDGQCYMIARMEYAKEAR